jgi:AcrR family transcriptional regulator
MNKVKHEIIEEAFHCFVELGFKQSTLREIARRGNRPASHIKYYFKDTNEIFIEAFKLMAVDGLKLTEQYSLECSSDEERLKAYLEAMLDWIGLNKNYQILWMMFSHQIIHDDNARKIFKDTLTVGHQRILKLIIPLLNKKTKNQVSEILAQNIQTMIIGTLYRISTYENYGPLVRKNLTATVLSLLAGAKSNL